MFGIKMNNGKICVSVCAETADELLKQIKRAEDLADVIEIRFDCLEESEFDLALQKASYLNCEKPFLATFRPKDRNAEFSIGKSSPETKIENSFNIRNLRKQRIADWGKILLLNKIKFIDIDEDLIFGILMNKFYDEQSSILLESFHQEITKHDVIVSLHDFERVPHNIEEIYAELSNLEESKTAKIAVHANDITDTIPIWKLLEKAKSENQQIIPIAMGEAGKWTRILGLAHGAFMTYASLDAGNETAPGQVSAKDLIEVYRAKELNEETEIYGIIGGNTSYSMSPYIHNAAFKFHNLNAVFVPLQVQNLDEFIRRMVKPETREIELNFKGFAVTIPHKQAIIKHLDYLDETAEKIGAVNTVKIADGKLYGYNTDAHGFIEPLKTAFGDLKNAKVAVLGAGGASRACVYALKKEGAEVAIFARDLKKAESLANEFQIELKTLSTQHSALSTFDIVINATPLGTKGNLENETPVTAEQIKNVHLAYDLVYNPLQTRFLREAENVNVPTISGLAMLIAQATRQQKIWTGLDAPMKEISQAAIQKLQN